MSVPTQIYNDSLVQVQTIVLAVLCTPNDSAKNISLSQYLFTCSVEDLWEYSTTKVSHMQK